VSDLWPGAPESQKHHPEEEVLNDIVKALETYRVKAQAIRRWQDLERHTVRNL
jgi:hypothetical protein